MLAPFPFADQSVSKLRPAILVSSLPHNAWLVIYVTSAELVATEYDVTLEPSATNNLLKPSVARVNRLTVITDTMITRTLGTLKSSERENIAQAITQIADNVAGESGL